MFVFVISNGTISPQPELVFLVRKNVAGGLGLPESTYRCHDADVSSAGRGASGLAGATSTHDPHTHDDEDEGDSTADHRQHAGVERTHARAITARGRGRRHDALLALARAHNVPVLTLRTLNSSVQRFVTSDAVCADFGAFHALVIENVLFRRFRPVRTVRTFRIARDIS